MDKNELFVLTEWRRLHESTPVTAKELWPIGEQVGFPHSSMGWAHWVRRLARLAGADEVKLGNARAFSLPAAIGEVKKYKI